MRALLSDVKICGRTDRYCLRSFNALSTMDTAKKPDSTELLPLFHVHVTATTVFAKIHCALYIYIYMCVCVCVMILSYVFFIL
jgi:hypothetical protein